MLGYKMTPPMVFYSRSNPLHNEMDFDLTAEAEFGPMQTAERAPFTETGLFAGILPPSAGHYDHFSDDCDAADMTHFYRSQPSSTAFRRPGSNQRFAPHEYAAESRGISFFREAESDAAAVPALWDPATGGLLPPPPPAVIQGVDLALASRAPLLTPRIIKTVRVATMAGPPLIRIIKNVRVTTKPYSRQSIFWEGAAPASPPRTTADERSRQSVFWQPAAPVLPPRKRQRQIAILRELRAARLRKASTEEVAAIPTIPTIRAGFGCGMEQQILSYRFSDESLSVCCRILEDSSFEAEAKVKKLDQDMFEYVLV